jgi:hypothetical protein
VTECPSTSSRSLVVKGSGFFRSKYDRKILARSCSKALTGSVLLSHAESPI